MLTRYLRNITLFLLLAFSIGKANAQEVQSDIDFLKEVQASFTKGVVHDAIKMMKDSVGINIYPTFHIADDSALWPYALELYFDVRIERKEPYVMVKLNLNPSTGKWTDFSSYSVSVSLTQGQQKAVPVTVLVAAEKQLNELLANIGNLREYFGKVRDDIAETIQKLRFAMMDKYFEGRNLPLVKFYPSSEQQFGFDRPIQQEIIGKYKNFYRYDTIQRVPWKALSTTKPDKINAYIQVRDTSFNVKNIRFVNSSDVKLQPFTTKGDTLVFHLTGTSKDQDDEITAEYVDTDPKGKERKAPIGQVKTIAYQEETNIVHIVPVGVKYPATEKELEKFLNKVYNQAVTNWTVVFDDPIKVNDWDIEKDGILNIETSMFQRYSDEEQVFIDALEKAKANIDPKAAYMFITDVPNNLKARGYMPLSAQFGFIFENGTDWDTNDKIELLNTTVAHELGHGIFKLKHPWDEYGTQESKTANLLDYQNGSILWKTQWDWIHDPGVRLYMFQKAAEGAVINRVAAIIEKIKSSNGTTPGTQIEIPWYGGTSSMNGEVTINGETLNCEIYLLNEKYLSNNKVRLTMPDFSDNIPSFNVPGQSNNKKTYYTKSVNYITFNEIKIEIKYNYLRGEYDIPYQQAQTDKVFNYISSYYKDYKYDENLIAKIKYYNARYDLAKTEEDKQKVVEDFLDLDIEPQYYKELSNNLRIGSIKKIIEYRINDTEEQEILFLIDNIKDADIPSFLNSLETVKYEDKNSLAIELINGIDDAGGRDYYTSLLKVIIKLAKKDIKRLEKLANYEPTKTIKLGYIPWYKAPKKQDFKYSTKLTSDQIIITESCYLFEKYITLHSGFANQYESQTPIYHWVESSQPIRCKPFDFVVLDDRSDVTFDLLTKIYEDNNYYTLDGIRAVPAIVIEYINNKKRNETLEDLTYISLDVLSMAVGIGELSTAYHILSDSRKIIVALDVINSAANIAVNVTDLQKNPTVNKWLSYYNAATLFSNLVVPYKGAKTLIREGSDTKLLARFAEFSGAARKGLRSLEDAIKTDKQLAQFFANNEDIFRLATYPYQAEKYALLSKEWDNAYNILRKSTTSDPILVNKTLHWLNKAENFAKESNIKLNKGTLAARFGKDIHEPSVFRMFTRLEEEVYQNLANTLINAGVTTIGSNKVTAAYLKQAKLFDQLTINIGNGKNHIIDNLLVFEVRVGGKPKLIGLDIDSKLKYVSGCTGNQKTYLTNLKNGITKFEIRTNKVAYNDDSFQLFKDQEIEIKRFFISPGDDMINGIPKFIDQTEIINKLSL